MYLATYHNLWLARNLVIPTFSSFQGIFGSIRSKCQLEKQLLWSMDQTCTTNIGWLTINQAPANNYQISTQKPANRSPKHTWLPSPLSSPSSGSLDNSNNLLPITNATSHGENLHNTNVIVFFYSGLSILLYKSSKLILQKECRH